MPFKLMTLDPKDPLKWVDLEENKIYKTWEEARIAMKISDASPPIRITEVPEDLSEN